MRIVEPRVTIEQMPTTRQALLVVERATRTAYQSFDRKGAGTVEAAERLVRHCLERRPTPHESVIEHVSATVRFIVDRGVTHELVRHRLAAFTQESTRYCNYAKGDQSTNGVAFIRPCFWPEGDGERAGLLGEWQFAMKQAELSYLRMIAAGARPEQARSVLPNSVKTEIVVTADFREWRHILTLRTHESAHPQMREVMRPLARRFAELHPAFFDRLPTVAEIMQTLHDDEELRVAEDLIAA